MIIKLGPAIYLFTFQKDGTVIQRYYCNIKRFLKCEDQLIELLDLVFTIIRSGPKVVQGWLDAS
jgi:hypothetical protein